MSSKAACSNRQLFFYEHRVALSITLSNQSHMKQTIFPM